MKRIPSFKILCLLGVLFCIQACEYNKAEPLVPIGPPLSFQADIKPIIVNNCLICHSDTSTNPEKNNNQVWFLKGPNHDDFSELHDYATRVSTTNSAYTKVSARIHGVELPRMPYNRAALPDSTINKIDRWIRQGALINN